MRTYLTSALLLSVSALLWCQPSGLEEAGQYQNKAASQLLSGDFEGAIQQLETAASLYESAQEWEYYFSCLNQVTNAYLSIGKTDAAKRTAKKALWESIQRLGRDNDEAAKAAHRLAEVYSRAGRHAKAIEVHNMGLMIRESIYGEQHTQLAASYDWIGKAWLAAGDFEKAATFYEQAMGLRKSLLGAQHPDVATSYTNLANLEAARNNYPQALAHYQTAFGINKNRLGGKHPEVAATLASMARINRLLGKEELAAQQYRQAALCYQENPAATGAAPAEAFHELSLQYYDNGNLEAAGRFAKQAVQALVLSNARNEEQAHRYYQSLGAILMEMGQYAEAAGSFRQALATGRGMSVANYQKWVEALRYSGSLPAALDGATRFLEWAEKQASPFAMLKARIQLGGLLIENGQGEEGVQQLAIVLNHADTPFWLLQEANQSLGDAYRRKGEYEKAIQQYKQQAEEWEQSHQAGALFFRFRALLAMGSTHSELAFQDRNTLFNLEAALNTFETCDEMLSGLLRSPLPTEQLAFLSTAREKLYRNAIKACYSLYQQNQEERYLRTAFYFSERSKELSLRIPLLLLPPSRFAGAPQALLEREARYRRAVQLLFSSLMHNRSHAEDTDSIQNEIEEKQAAFQAVLAELKQQAPHYYNLKFGGEVVTPEKVNATLQQHSATLYSYYLDGEDLFIFHFTHEGFQLFRQPVDDVFRASLHDFIRLISNEPDRANSVEATYRQATALAVQLYSRLLPGEPEGQHLFILPHGLLQWLPYEALLPSAPPKGNFTNLPYLGLSHSVSYYASATALAHAGSAPSFHDYASPFEAFVQAGGSDNEHIAMKSAYAANGEGANSRSLFHELAQGWAADENGRLWEGAMAQEAIFNNLPSAEVLLMALPVEAGSFPDDTFVSFSNEADSLADNRLYLQEAYGFQKPVDLYILASVVPQSSDRSGWLQLAEALRYSRCRSLLLHRWPATGQPSVELLQLFRDSRAAGSSVAKALQQARREYLSRLAHSPERAHPYYWAGYLAYSIPTAPAPAPGIPRFWIIAAVGGLILVGWLVRLH